MIKIGITGGIGSGKSTVCKVFELLGVPVYYADNAAKELLENDSDVKDKIVTVFGREALDEKNAIDKKRLAAIVFNDKPKLEQLNAIVHPAVANNFNAWQKQNYTAPYLVKEAAILFESGAYKGVDRVITVVAPLEIKIARVMQRDKVDREQVEQRIKSQLSDEEKIERSQYVIYNDEQALLIPQIIKIHNELSLLHQA
ncbi:MAG: dephospho-CoA kinase [Bacteroidia bacterium]